MRLLNNKRILLLVLVVLFVGFITQFVYAKVYNNEKNSVIETKLEITKYEQNNTTPPPPIEPPPQDK